jgi:hypothetical protein
MGHFVVIELRPIPKGGTMQTYTITLDERQHATVLAALRCYQAGPLPHMERQLDDLATWGGTLVPLSHTEIGALCEYVNLDGSCRGAQARLTHDEADAICLALVAGASLIIDEARSRDTESAHMLRTANSVRFTFIARRVIAKLAEAHDLDSDSYPVPCITEV